MTTMIGLPLVSILMFILAGILIGHLLWYHDRKADLRRISKLEDRYQVVRGTAIKRKQEFARLQTETQSHQHVLDQTRAQTNAALASQQQADGEARTAKQELAQLSQENEQLNDHLNTETRRSESVIVQLKEALESRAEIENRLSETENQLAGVSQSVVSEDEIAETFRDRIEELQQLNVQAAEEHSQEAGKLRDAIAKQAAAAAQTTREKEGAILRLTNDLEANQQSESQSSKAIEDVQHKIESIASELEAVQADRERLSNALTQKSGELEQLQRGQTDRLQERDSKLAELSRKLDEQTIQLQRATAQHDAVNTKLQQLEKEKSELVNELQELKAVQEELQETSVVATRQKAAIEQQAKLIANQQDELAEHIERLSSKEIEITDLRKQESELQDLRKAVQQISALKTERDTLRSQIKETSESQKQQEETLAAKESRIATLSKSLAEFEATKQQLAESKQQLSVVAADRQRIDQAHQGLQKNVDDLRSKISGDAKSIDRLKAQLGEKIQALATAMQQAKEATRQLETQTASASKLSKDLGAVEKLRPENKELQRRVDELIQRLKLVTNEHEDSLQTNAKAEDRIRDLQNQMHDDANKIRDLRRQRASMEELPSDATSPNDNRRAA